MDDADKWSSAQMDFLIVARRDDGTLAASIPDVHGDYLGDAKAKLRALADFADDGHLFLRVQSIAKAADGNLRCLDLLDTSVGKAVRAFEGGKIAALYVSDSAMLFK